MNAIGQHVPGITCLEHSIFVSYISFLMCRRLGLNYSAAARGGLLHDLYLADWKAQRVGMWKRLVIHPEMAVKNAAAFGLSDLEKDIIRNHMWPVTITKFPRKRESAVVSLADKISTLCEVLRISHWMRSNHLSELFSAPEYGFAAAVGSADAAS
jgi:uncharacterized protein